MAKRYEIADLLSAPRNSRRLRADDRLMLHGIFWVLRSGDANGTLRFMLSGGDINYARPPLEEVQLVSYRA